MRHLPIVPDLHPLCARRGMAGLLGYLGMLAVGLVACGGDATSPPPASDIVQSYWTLHLNQHAVLLALTPGQDTIYLAATARNASGQPVSGLGPVQYTPRDSTVTVDANGLVTARYVTGQQTAVVATLTDTVRHITQLDTCFLQVTTTASTAPLSGFTLQSPSGDTIPLGQNFTLTTSVTDAQGNPATVVSYFQSADKSIAAVTDKFNGTVVGKRLGQVLLYAETWAYGVAKRDSLAVTVGLPSAAQISAVAVTPTGSTHAVLTFWPQIVRVSAGTVVTWVNGSYTDSLDVQFDDPAHVDSAKYVNFLIHIGSGQGNITPWVYDTLGTNSISAGICTGMLTLFAQYGYDCIGILTNYPYSKQRLRKFPVAGTYHYHSTKWGTSGTILVQ